MSIKVNNINGANKNLKHDLNDYVAFLDSDGDFYLIDNEINAIVHILGAGCDIHQANNFDTIEDFLYEEFGYDCTVQKVFRRVSDYEIIINC